jgi:hypothetical protein
MWRSVPLAGLFMLVFCTRPASPQAPITVNDSLVSPTSTSSSVEEELSTLVVRQRYRGPSYYIEGSIGFVEVSAPGAGGPTREEWRIEGRGVARVVLRSGTYSLTSWQRPCDGNCEDGFDPPVDGCEASFTVERAEKVIAVVTVTPDSGCTIVFV